MYLIVRNTTQIINYRHIEISHFENLQIYSFECHSSSDEQFFAHWWTAQLSAMSFCNYVFNDCSRVNVMYTDFAEAFDSVNPVLLLYFATGFGEPLLSWFLSYSSHKSRWVKTLWP